MMRNAIPPFVCVWGGGGDAGLLLTVYRETNTCHPHRPIQQMMMTGQQFFFLLLLSSSYFNRSSLLFFYFFHHSSRRPPISKWSNHLLPTCIQRFSARSFQFQLVNRGWKDGWFNNESPFTLNFPKSELNERWSSWKRRRTWRQSHQPMITRFIFRLFLGRNAEGMRISLVRLDFFKGRKIKTEKKEKKELKCKMGQRFMNVFCQFIVVGGGGGC